MAIKKNIFTKEGYQKLKEELERLKSVVRLEIAGKLNEATGFGDLSENAAYQAAMELRDMNENKIAELEETLANAKVVKTVVTKDEVNVGSKVKLEDQNGNILEFEIVGTGETDLVAKKFNADSPLASAVLGKKKGDSADLNLPSGKMVYKIISVK
jgi:transcription elongation factor GreA